MDLWWPLALQEQEFHDRSHVLFGERIFHAGRVKLIARNDLAAAPFMERLKQQRFVYRLTKGGTLLKSRRSQVAAQEVHFLGNRKELIERTS